MLSVIHKVTVWAGFLGEVTPTSAHKGFPDGAVIKNHLPMQEAQDMWPQSPGQEDSLKKEMVTHSSILAREIPQTEEPGGLQSRGLQRVGHH